MDNIVSTEWLAAQNADEGMVILDASAHLPDAGREPEAEYASAHIPGARYLALPTLKDERSEVPAALPTAEQFEARMRDLGVNDSDRIVLYDDSKLRSSARAYFICRMFGVKDVAILDGGMEKWKAEGRALESGTVEVGSGDFTIPDEDRTRVRSKAQMLANCSTGGEQVVDARDAARFTAETDDAVHGLAGGHIPGARNVFFRTLMNDDGTFKSEEALSEAFRNAGLDLDRPITASCGSGMTASVLLFALERLGHADAGLYDGSWLEWGADPATPKESGPAR